MNRHRSELRICLGGEDIAKWAANRLALGGGADLNVTRGIFISGSNAQVIRDIGGDSSDVPHLDPGTYVEFTFGGGDWHEGVDYDDPRALTARALDVLLHELGDPNPSLVRIEVEHK